MREQIVEVLSGVPGPQGPPGPKGDSNLLAPASGYPVIATNLVQDPSSLGNTWAAGYGDGAGTLQYFTSGGYNNRPYAKLTWTTAPTGYNGLYFLPSGSYVSISEGSPLSVSMRVSGNLSGKITVDWYDNNSSVTGSYAGNIVSLPNTISSAMLVVAENLVAPPGTTKCKIRFRCQEGSVTSGSALAVSDVLVVQSPSIIDYFDGNTPGARWAGTENNSFSELITPRKIDLKPKNYIAYEKNLATQPRVVSNTDIATAGAGYSGNYFPNDSTMSIQITGGTLTLDGVTLPYRRKTITTDGSNISRLTWLLTASNPDVTTNYSYNSLKVEPNKTYRISVWAKLGIASGITGSIGISFGEYNYDGSRIAYNTIYQSAVSGWQNVIASFTTTSTTSHAAIKLAFGGTWGSLAIGDTSDICGLIISDIAGRTTARPDYFDGYYPNCIFTNDDNNSESVRLSPSPSAISRIDNSGTGYPEGFVIASPGARYIDTAATNGASEWTKLSGTGASGWTVTTGDTGWRTITSLAVNGWTLAGTVRRIGSQVQLHIASITGSSATAQNFLILPTGFRASLSTLSFRTPLLNLSEALYTSNIVRHDNDGKLYVMGASYTAVSGARVVASYFTDDTWPATLP